MNHTLITYWKTLDGSFYTSASNYANYDSGIGNYHSKFKPMQNDENVATFTLLLTDEYGNKVEKCTWTRQTELPKAEEEA